MASKGTPSHPSSFVSKEDKASDLASVAKLPASNSSDSFDAVNSQALVKADKGVLASNSSEELSLDFNQTSLDNGCSRVIEGGGSDM